MDSNLVFALQQGLAHSHLLYPAPNAYYPTSIRELLESYDEIEPTFRFGVGEQFNGIARIFLKSGFYLPHTSGESYIEDLDAQLLVDITDYSDDLPQTMKYVEQIVLEKRENEQLPYLVSLTRIKK